MFLVFMWEEDYDNLWPLGADAFVGAYSTLDLAKESIVSPEVLPSWIVQIAEFDGQCMHIVTEARVLREEHHHTETRRQQRSPTVVIEQTGEIFDGYTYSWQWSAVDRWVPDSGQDE